jgi:DNA-binding beta-propeller fold protein YncE
LAVIHSAATGRVNIFDLSGNCIGSTSMTNTPTGAAYHSLSNKILVTYSGNSSISAHNPTTGAQSPASAIYTSAGQLSTPRAIAADANGYIYVGSDGLDQVIKLYWDGVSASATYVGTIIQTSVFTQNITSIVVVP